MKAQIYKSGKREFDCKIISTGQMVVACAHGNLLKGKESLVVGDYVVLAQNGQGEHIITKRERRFNEVYRVIVREQKKKVTAANCDYLVIISSVSRPEYKRGIIDRYLIRAFQWGIYPLVVFNKMDQHSPEDVDITFEQKRLERAGVKCFEVSAKDENYRPQYLANDFSQLKETIQNKTAIFLGQSGVGKSKIISLISEGKINLKGHKVGKSGKGSHTTTWSEIVDYNHFSLIDSPGIRSFSVEDILEDELLELFPDLEAVATQCKFKNCQHGEKIKGCAFWQQNLDDYERACLFSRLESYRKIFDEIAQVPSWKKI